LVWFKRDLAARGLPLLVRIGAMPLLPLFPAQHGLQ
jgi:hypothetical protein